MRGRLVGDDVDGELACAVAAQHLREDLCGVAHKTHGQRALLVLRVGDQLDRFLEVGGDLVEVTLALAALQAGLIHVHDQAGTAVEGDGQRLCATHATAAAGQGQGASQGAVETLLRHSREGLVSALQDALGGDVDPGAGRHLAVHHQALVLELAEVLPVRPVAHQVGIGDEHSRRPLVGFPHTNRLAGLNQQGLVGFEVPQGLHNRVEGFPATSGAAGAAVDDEVVWALRNLRVEVVLQHAQRSLGLPRLRGDFRAARGADLACAFGPVLRHMGILSIVAQSR